MIPSPRSWVAAGGRVTALRIRTRVIYGLTVLVVLAVAPRAGAAVTVTTEPTLYPAFDEAVTDYVTRCTAGMPVGVSVSAIDGTTLDVDGQGPRSGTYTTTLRSCPARRFEWSRRPGLPARPTTSAAFPPTSRPGPFSAQGRPQAQWYAIAPATRTDFSAFPPGVSPNYVALFDTNGVPVWWMKAVEFRSTSRCFVTATSPGRATTRPVTRSTCSTGRWCGSSRPLAPESTSTSSCCSATGTTSSQRNGPSPEPCPARSRRGRSPTTASRRSRRRLTRLVLVGVGSHSGVRSSQRVVQRPRRPGIGRVPHQLRRTGRRRIRPLVPAPRCRLRDQEGERQRPVEARRRPAP